MDQNAKARSSEAQRTITDGAGCALPIPSPHDRPCCATTRKGFPCLIDADRLHRGQWYCHLHDPDGLYRQQVVARRRNLQRRRSPQLVRARVAEIRAKAEAWNRGDNSGWSEGLSMPYQALTWCFELCDIVDDLTP